MKHFYILLILTFLSPLFSLAQSNYKPGYVVTLNGDTLNGYIDYRQWDRNPTEIKFKNSPSDSQAKTFTTINTWAFGVNGLEFYDRKQVPVSTDKVEINSLSTGLDTNYNTSLVFLRLLTKGKNVTLYVYTDFLKERFYIKDNQTENIQELGYHLYFQPNTSTLQTINQFRFQLESFAQKFGKSSPVLDKQIQDANYTRNAILKIAIQINGSNDVSSVTSENLFGDRFFAGAAIIDNENDFTYKEFPNTTSLFPQISTGIDLFPNKIAKKFFIRLEFAVTGEHHSGSITGDYGNDGFSTANYSDSKLNLSLIPQVQYNVYNGATLKAFINLGYAINYSFFLTNNYYVDNKPELSLVVLDFRHLWKAVPIKVGVTLKNKLEIYAGYAPSTIITTDITTDIRNIQYQAGVNYLFDVK